MPIAITPRRRSRDELESDEARSTSPDVIPSSQPELNSAKRSRLNNGNVSPAINGRPLTNGHHTQPHGLQQETLRSKSTKRKHQPGSIVRVKLANFVTYTAVEFFPGPSLNMVIGPNGTGKSTLVCAICLGLGWGPQHLGRAKEVSEFVKHGCQEAMIEIELAKDGKRFKRNIVIRCTIKRDGNKTVFSVDGKSQGKKAVIELCRSLSIQIDNLCQFLPQDKVVEFAAMTPVELLRSTQRAVATQETIEWHDELKDLGKKQKEVSARLTSDQEILTNLEGRQRLQEADVERMREREQVEKRVRMLEASRPFAAYRGARLLHRETKEKRKDAQDELTRLENEVEPSLRAYNAKERYLGQIGAAITERKQGISRAERHADGIDQKFRDLQDRQNELIGEHNAEANSGKNARKGIARYELSISNLKRQMEEHPAEVDTQAYNEQIREKRRAIEACRGQIRELQEQQQGSVQRGREVNGRILQARQDLENLDSQTGKQNIKLQSTSPHTAKVWEWVQQHQDDFEKPVSGPPIIECSVKDPAYVDQIETLFQRTIMLSFTVQTNNDFKKLSTQADKMGLKDVYLKTLVSGVELGKFKAPVSRDDMRRFGLESWAIEHMNGPDVILAMLCGEVNLHQTGVAMRDTTTEQYNRLESSPIQTWVTKKQMFRFLRRREYGAAGNSTQVRNTRPAVVWTDQPVDLTAKRELQENIQNWSDEIDAIKASNQEAHQKIDGYRQEMNKLADEEKEISAEKAAKQKALGDFKALPTRLAAVEEKMATSQKAMTEVKDRLRTITDTHDEIANERGQIALDHANAVEALQVCHNNSRETMIMFIEASSECETLKERNQSVKELLDSQKRKVDDLVKEVRALHQNAQRLIQVCQTMLSADNEDEELRTFFRSLPESQTAEELEAEIESEKARLELMHEGNGGVIKEYETRKKKIDLLTSKLDEIKEASSELDDRIKGLRDQWEPQLDGLVDKISYSFSTNMEQISCAGEVGIHKDDDFDQWAIQIRVKFRENEPFSPLDSHRQSGGERAVSTIFYLMSLQSLTRSPFRVVDEINQGMDPRNERLVHKRMVGIACGDAESASTYHHNHNNVNGNTNHRGSTSRFVPPDGILSDREDEDEDGDDDDDNEESNPTTTAGPSSSGGSQYFLITPKLLNNLTYSRGMRVLCIASGEYMPPDRNRVDFKACADIMRGLRATGGIGGGIGFGVGNGVAAA